MFYPNYLIHFNKNHSSKNGQFISGDGDGDGITDDHHRYSENGIKPVSKKLSKYTGKDAKKNLDNDGFQKVADNLSEEYGKRYGNKSGENTKAAEKKYKKAMQDLEEAALKKSGQKYLNPFEFDDELFEWWNKEYTSIVNQDEIDYGRAWMKDLGINESDADVINKFLGKY